MTGGRPLLFLECNQAILYYINMKKVVFCIFLAAILFATMEVALKTGGKNLDPVQLTFLRFALAAIVLGPFAVAETKKSGYKFNKNDMIWMSLVGVLGIGISMLSFQYGVNGTNAHTAASIMGLNPLFTMVIANAFTSEKMDRLRGVAFALGIIAIILLARPWDVQEGNTHIGILLMLVSVITFAVYTVMGKRSIARIGTYTQTSIGFVAGCLVLLIVMIATGRPVVDGVAENWGAVLYTGICVTGIGYWAYFTAIKNSDATTGSIVFFIKPIIAPFFAVLVLHERVALTTVAGLCVLVCASFITLYDSWKNRVHEEGQ